VTGNLIKGRASEVIGGMVTESSVANDSAALLLLGGGFAEVKAAQTARHFTECSLRGVCGVGEALLDTTWTVVSSRLLL
jgi:hypothetical protein